MAIEHQKATVTVYFTRDYSLFKNIRGNRLLSERKINKIIKDIENGFDMLKYCPIIVDSNMNVIDGQHRLQICRMMKSNVWYTIAPELTLHEIAKLNSNTERWKVKDFLHCYEIGGNEDYKKLREFSEKYGFNVMASAILLMRGTLRDGSRNEVTEAFEAGTFKIKEEAKAIELVEIAIKFKLHSGYTTRAFLSAINRLKELGLVDWDHMFKQFERCHTTLPKHTTEKDYLKALEDMYNFHQQKRRTIYE